MLKAKLTKFWAYSGIALVMFQVAFLFLYIFIKGADSITWEFLTQAPRGAVLGEEGGIFPAIMGSLAFTLTAVVIGGIPAIATAIYLVFYSERTRFVSLMRGVIQCIAGIPSIVLGLFAYSLLVRDLGLGRCVLSSGVALAVMILPFIEVRAEKALSQVPPGMIASSYALGCSRWYTVWHIALPYARAELASAVILGGCYAMGATPPLIFTGGVAFAGVPTSLTEPAMALPLHLYLLVAQGTPSLGTAFGTAFVMMAIIFISNLLVTYIAGRRKLR